MTRLPLGPLLLAAQVDPDRWASQLADRCGVTTRTCHRWARDGLGLDAADRAAVALGLHPLLVWIDWADGIDVGVVAA